ncbi:MAG: hypothetical protein ACRC7G_18450 [Beijerinckiaceae bacterium]
MSTAKSVRVLLAFGCALSAGACDKYLDRRDTVSFGAGDAVAANKAMHIIDPWNQASRTVEHGSSGEHAAAAIERLRKRPSGDDAPPAAPMPVLLTNAAPPKP